MRTLLEAILLTVACMALYLVGSAQTPFYTRGEAREALVVREVVRTGEWIVPRRPEGELTRKPPLYYWAAATATVARPTSPEQAARLPSAIGGATGVLATWAAARFTFGTAAGMPAALVLATSLQWIQSATRARIDMCLAAALAVVLLAWVRLAHDRSVLASTLALVAAAAGVLAKGPVAIVLPAAAATLAWIPNVRRVGLMRFVIPLVLATLVGAAWYALAYLDQGQAFLDIVMAENVGRFVDAAAADVGHRHGVAYLLGLGLVGLLPWTPLLPLAGSRLRDWRRPPVAILLAWVVVVPTFFAIASGKRDVYLLPMYPAVAALLGAGLIVQPGPGVARTVRVLAVLYAPILAAVALGFLLYGTGIDPAVVAHRWLTPTDADVSAALAAAGSRHAVALLGLAAVSLVVAFVVERHRRREEWRALATTLGAFLVIVVGVFQGAIHPALARTRSPRDFFHRVQRQLPHDEPIYAFAPIDQRVRFYGPGLLTRFPRGGLDRTGLAIGWDRELEHRRDADGKPLEVIARDGQEDESRGALVLVRVPPGPLTRSGGRRSDGGSRGDQNG